MIAPVIGTARPRNDAHAKVTGAATYTGDVAPADPLNLTGVLLPCPRTASLAQGTVHLLDGVQHPAGSAYRI